MRIQYCSDLHREFLRDLWSDETPRGEPANYDNENYSHRFDRWGWGLGFFIDKVEDVDVLVLAGDIDYFRLADFEDFLRQGTYFARHVVYVPGNHCFWKSRIQKVYELREKFKDDNNIHILYNDSVEIDGKLFYGGTMWSDINPINDHAFMHLMRDFKKIKLFKPRDARAEHRKFVDGLSNILPHVIVSHFLPCTKSIHPRFCGQQTANDYYCTDMTAYFYGVELWIHGHSHDAVDYTVGDTRVISNPHGYIGYEDIGKFNRTAYIDI